VGVANFFLGKSKGIDGLGQSIDIDDQYISVKFFYLACKLWAPQAWAVFGRESGRGTFAYNKLALRTRL